ncbi:hypothetical protein [Actinomadura rubrisoli]|uniref:Uncharacterized protein n=1 Tax=Actinomadura rubrisoli TaxID=2530368 RepID=A0A4R5C6A4_9ACTN|nr:hypothetical protein [Actinomadura rubrisoli]TDD92504.1 hypothetical protein E1298_10830 [Actinomadura rubrisoli]
METMSHAEAVAGIGARPPGDPEGMRRLADDLRRIARELGSVQRIRIEHWDSGRAREAKARIAGAARTASDVSHDLGRAARLLDQEAAELVAARGRWARRYTDLTGEAPP